MSKIPKSMKELSESYSNRLVPFKNGDIVEVKVLEISKSKILVDVAGLYLGVIYEKEFSPDMSEARVGEKILAYILTLENAEGNCVLSLRRADKEKVAKILENKFTTGGVIAVKCHDANRGGLLCGFGDYDGFLPVSQLATSHYPKVGSGDKEEILTKLKKLTNQNFQVKILSFESGTNKLIFSEKAAGDIVQQEKIKKYKIDDILEGEITGIVDFGLFMNLGEVEGLVHISEVSWDHVDDLKAIYKVGQKIKVKIISIDNNRISLSIKKLSPDPWIKEVEKFKPGSKIKGVVTKITPFGAFVSLGEIGGLVHVSMLGGAAVHEKLEVGKSYPFEVIKIEKNLRKLNLTLVGEDSKKNIKTEKKSTAVAKTKKKPQKKSVK